jgi:4-hydroxy-2-oxoheptanedioate aldolase
MADRSPRRINRAIELLEADQALYYDGPHTGHVLTYEQGKKDAKTWADYINVGMEHGAFDMTGLEDYMRGLLDGGPTRSGHLTPTVIVEAPVNGIDGPNVAFNAWQFRQILARGVHGILLCQAESADAVKEFVRACRFQLTALLGSRSLEWRNPVCTSMIRPNAPESIRSHTFCAPG